MVRLYKACALLCLICVIYTRYRCLVNGLACNRGYSKRVFISQDDLIDDKRECTYLRICGKRLEEIGHKAFLDYERLEKLALFENLIHTIHHTAFIGVHLKELDLNNNKLKCIPDLFYVKNTLETLILSNNNLGSCIKDTVYYADFIFVKLHKIYLDEAHLKVLPGIVLAAPHLKILSLRRNLFPSPPNLLHVCPALSTLNLLGNRMLCGCDLIWLYEMELTRGISSHMFECDAAGKHSYRNWTAIDKCKLNQTC